MHNFNEKKYKILRERGIILRTGITVYRIEALKSFDNVKKGDIGGYVESYNNLSQEGYCWIYDDSIVFQSAIVKENSYIHDNSIIKGKSEILNSLVKGSSIIEDSTIRNESIISLKSKIRDSVIDSSTIINSHISDACLNYLKIKDGDITSPDEYICVKGLGSRNGKTVFYTNREGEVVVTCGCFFGTIKEFKQRVKCEHVKDETGFNKFREEYLRLIKIMRIHFYGLRS